MNRRIFLKLKRIVATALTTVLLTGCVVYVPYEEESPKNESENTESEVVKETSVQTIEPIEKSTESSSGDYVKAETEVQDSVDTKDNKQAERNEIGITDQEIAAVLKQEEGKFYLSACQSEEEKILYAEILQIMLHRASDIQVSTMNADLVDRVYQFVMNDHPEIFYSNGYTYTRHTVDGELKYLTFTGNYTYSLEEIESRNRKLDANVSAWISGCPANADEYGKVCYVYETVIRRTEYKLDSQDNQNICSVFLNGESVCQGYAKAVQYLLNHLGVYATLVVGYANGENHAWNLVQVDGNYYYVDATWGDASYQTNPDSQVSQELIPDITYDYLCVPSNWLFRTHSLNQLVNMPECNSLDANYYVKNGLYLSNYDKNIIKAIFQTGYQNGANYVTLKCASQDIYNNVYSQMVTNQDIFQFLQSQTETVSYALNEAELTISFWL